METVATNNDTTETTNDVGTSQNRSDECNGVGNRPTSAEATVEKNSRPTCETRPNSMIGDETVEAIRPIIAEIADKTIETGNDTMAEHIIETTTAKEMLMTIIITTTKMQACKNT